MGEEDGFEKGIQSFCYCSLFQPVVTSQLGTINNLIHVKKSDFEVFDALKLDSMESSETSCRGNSGLLLSLFVFLTVHIPSPKWSFTLFVFSLLLRNLVITPYTPHSNTNPWHVCLSYSDTLFSILPLYNPPVPCGFKSCFQ